MREEKLNDKNLSNIIGGREDTILVALPHTMGPDGIPGSGRGGGTQIRAISGIPAWHPYWWK
ncbi:bacteriocin [uncultured Lactobacillus sp.]|uniref:bacteriocin n=1 Tax=uncultured Lactobacillus sp. TaxID=153152 RepID=UPI0028053399|nr:bacteriocin [uncultured Lactobacillus sp.]